MFAHLTVDLYIKQNIDITFILLYILRYHYLNMYIFIFFDLLF